MSHQPARRPFPEPDIAVDTNRLWAGGLATAFVAGLAAAVGVLIVRDIAGVKLQEPSTLLGLTDSLAFNYAFTAFLLALAACGIGHLLSLTTPRPRVFFTWIVGLVTVAAMVVPFAGDASLGSQLSTAVINLVVGLAVASLLSAVLSRTVVDAERTWQEP
ncbi:MAG: DUF6069 family protein [Terracoccus sp.]